MARQLSESTILSPAAIARRSGMSASSVRRLAQAQDWRRPSSINRQRLMRRLWETAERQAMVLEAQTQVGDLSAMSRDLASLTKVLRDLAALETQASEAPSLAAPVDSATLRDKIRGRLARLHADEANAPTRP